MVPKIQAVKVEGTKSKSGLFRAWVGWGGFCFGVEHLGGGFFGVGVGEGQVKWSLPDAHTDFIIAVAAEEYGFVLVGLILITYSTIVCVSLARLLRERDVFVRLAGTGLVCMFGIQAVINIGVAARLLPAKGMTLPFVSYGGSSLIAGGIAMGILLSLTRNRPQKNVADIFIKG